MKVSPAFSKAAGCRGRAPARAPQSAESSFCSHEIRKGVQGGNPIKGFPPSCFSLSTCAPIRWEVVVALPCDSTPFLWCLPKETVSSRQRKALFYPGGSTIRVSAPASVVFTHLRPTWGRGLCGSVACACAPFPRAEVAPPCCPFHPISLLLRKETGWSPKETRFWVPPRQLFGPARLSHGLEAPTSQPTASS